MTALWMHSPLTNCLLAAASMPVLEPVSPDAAVLRHLFVVVFVVCVLILAVVAGLITVSLIRFRAKDAAPPAQNFGSHRAEIAWTIPPVVIVALFALSSARVIVRQS